MFNFRNILIKNNHLKLCNLELAKNILNSSADTFAATLYYMSPEMIDLKNDLSKSVDPKTDVWYLK